MKKNSFGNISALVLSLAGMLFTMSCSKEATCYEGYSNLSKKVPVTISADRNIVFKTSLNGKAVEWCEGDEVSVFAFNKGLDIDDRDLRSAVSEIEGSKASITAIVKDICTPDYVIYPASESSTLNRETGELTTFIPAEYNISAGTFPTGSNVAAGKINDGKVTLYNMFALMKFELTSSDISKVIFTTARGEALCGVVTLDCNSLSVKKVEGGNEVTLCPETGKDVFDAGIYYLPVPPLEMKEGFYIRLIDSDGFTAKKIHAKTYTPIANKVINLGKQSEWGIDVHIGAVETGTPSIEGDDIIVSGNSFRIKYQQEAVDVTFGIEYSLDACISWNSIAVTDGFKTTFDCVIPNVMKNRKYHVRSWAQYKNDEKSYGEEKVLNLIDSPITFDIDFFDFNSEVPTFGNLKYIGTDPDWFWPFGQATEGRTIANVEDRFSYKVNDGFTVFFSVFNPSTVSKGYYFDNSQEGSICGWCYRDKNIWMTTPAIPDFKLDKVEVLVVNNTRATQMYFSQNAVSSNVLGGNGKMSNLTDTETIGDKTYYVAKHKDLSTVGTKHLSTDNTEHFIYFSTNGACRKIHYTYVPSEE